MAVGGTKNCIFGSLENQYQSQIIFFVFQIFRKTITILAPGAQSKLRVLRNGKEIEIVAIIGKRPRMPERAER